MRSQFLIAVLTIANATHSFAQLREYRYKLPDVTLTATQVSGTSELTPGNVGRPLSFTRTPFSPAVNKATTAKEVAMQVLGQTLPFDKLLTSKDFSTCSESSNNPFTLSDIDNVRFPDGRSIDYTRTEKLEIDVSAAVDANVRELLKMTNDLAKIDRLKGKIQAAYTKVKGKELSVVGKYSEWELSQSARDRIKKGDGFQACRKWMEDNNQRILLSAGIVYFEIKFEQNSLDQLASQIDAELAREGLTGSLSFSFKKEITTRLKTSNEVYQILAVRHAGIKNKVFVE